MAAPLNLQVDDDGFVCIVSPEFYSGFVAADWDLEDLLEHFVQQANLGALFVAYPGPDHANDLLMFDSSSAPSDPYRKALGIVRVGSEGLWLTDYTQLTMAAQFEDTAPIARYATHLPVPEGTHLLVLTQASGDATEFHLSWEPATDGTTSQVSAVPWFE